MRNVVARYGGMRNVRSVQALFSICFRWIALLLLVLVLGAAGRTLIFLGNSTKVVGTVQGYREIRNYAPFGLFTAEEAARYFVEVRYRASGRAADGEGQAAEAEAYTVTAARGSSERLYEIGQAVEARYSNRRPEYARLNTRADLWGGTIALLILTAVFGVLALITPFAFRLGDEA